MEIHGIIVEVVERHGKHITGKKYFISSFVVFTNYLIGRT